MLTAGLQGRRVVVTRARADADAFCDLLSSHGAEAVRCPLIRIAAPDDTLPLERAAAQMERYDAAVIGSVHAASALAQALRRQGRATSVPIACVGAKTAARLAEDKTLRTVFRGPRWVPTHFRAERLFERIQGELGKLAGRRILFPRAPEGRTVLIEHLSAAGAEVDAPLAYRIVSEDPAQPEVLASVEAADAWTFMSGNTLEAAFDVLGEGRARRLLAETTVAAIGPVAAERAARLGIRVDVVPERATAEDLVHAVEAHLAAPLEQPVDES